MGFLRGIHRRAGRGGLDKDVSPLFRNSPNKALIAALALAGVRPVKYGA